jgi:hypothetical protein
VGFEFGSRKNWFFGKYGPAHEAESRTGEAIRFNLFVLKKKQKGFPLLSGLKGNISFFAII